MTKKHIVVAMTGASGAALGIQTLRILRTQGIESHLILSNWARRTIELETDLMAEDATALADHVYQADDLSATIFPYGWDDRNSLQYENTISHC